MKKDASEILKMVSGAITRTYDPKGDKIFSFAFIGQMNGKILHESIAILTGKSGEHNNTHVLYVVSPQALDDYYNPLAALQLIPMGKAGTMIEFYYPERTNSAHAVRIINIIKNELTNMNENWSHQLNWIN